jgi:hypothetical protein
MARIRSIKPEILEDEKTAPLSDGAFRLFASMIFLADDHGNVRADSRWLQAQIWWAHASPPRTAEFLREVSNALLIQVYEVRGGIYAHLLGWEKHQRIDNAGKCRVPMPNDADVKPFSFLEVEETNGSRNFAEDFREKPLDPDPDRDPDKDGDRDRDAAAKAPLAKLKAKADRAPKSKRVHPLPSDWAPRPQEQERARVDGIDCGKEADSFRDHHAAKGSRFEDWDAAFRNWLRNAVKFGNNRRPANGLTPLEQQLERVRMLEAQEAEQKALP